MRPTISNGTLRRLLNASTTLPQGDAASGGKRVFPLLLLTLLMATGAASSFAAETSAKGNTAGDRGSTVSAASDDEEETFDEKLREFGYWSGVALNCMPDSRQLETERKVLSIYQRIVQLFGTDRGFFYAAALGRGSSVKLDPAKCPEFLEKFEKAAAVHRSLQPGP